MDGFSVTSLTSLCTSIANRAASSAAELDALIRSSDAATISDPLRSHHECLTKLNHETLQLEQALNSAACISQRLQKVLSNVLTMGDATLGKLHKQLMRLQPENARDVDTAYLSKFVAFLIAYVQVFEFFNQALSLNDGAEQDALVTSSPSQLRLQDAEKAFNDAAEATSIFLPENIPEKGPTIGSLPQRPRRLPTDTDAEAGDEPPPYSAETPTISSSAVQASPSSSRDNAGPFGSLAKSFKAFKSHFVSGPDPLVSALCQTIVRGELQQASDLLAQGANVNGRGEDGNSPLYCAIMSDNEDALRLLLAAGASSKGSGWFGLPPLFQAASAGKLRIAKALLEQGAHVEEQSMSGQHFFVDVCASENLAGIEFLLQHGAEATWENTYGRPVLVQAIKKDNIELVKLLLRYGAKATTSDITGSTSLALATEKKDIALAKVLLDHGAMPEGGTVYDNYGNNVLGNAILQGRLDLATLLLDRGANGDQAYSGQPLIINVLKSDKVRGDDKVDLIRRLLHNGASANAKDNTAALCHALEGPSSSPAIVELLLQHGAKPNKCEMSTGETLLLYAMDKDKKEELRLLLQHRADPNGKDKQGRVPLLQAMVRQDTEMVRLLRHHGASLDATGTVSVKDMVRALAGPDKQDMLKALGL